MGLHKAHYQYSSKCLSENINCHFSSPQRLPWPAKFACPHGFFLTEADRDQGQHFSECEIWSGPTGYVNAFRDTRGIIKIKQDGPWLVFSKRWGVKQRSNLQISPGYTNWDCFALLAMTGEINFYQFINFAWKNRIYMGAPSCREEISWKCLFKIGSQS